MKKLTTPLAIAVMCLAMIAGASACANSRTATSPQGPTSSAQGQAASSQAQTPAPQAQTSAPARNDRVLTNPEAGLEFELPKGWRAEERGQDLLVWTADGTVQIDIWVPGNDTFDVALRNLDRDLGKVVKNIKVLDRGTSDTHNGMRHFSTAGTGTVDGWRCEWSVDVLDARNVALILSFWRPGIADKHSSEGDQFFNSIKKMN